MSYGKVPVNGLDRAIMAALRSKAEMPSFFRELAMSKLWFVTPYKKGMVGGEKAVGEAKEFTFKRYSDVEGKFIPVFSSRERLEEFQRAGKDAGEDHGVVEINARTLLTILGGTAERVVLNKACSTGGMELPRNLMRDIGDGTVLKPKPPGTGDAKRIELKVIEPADYPTNIVQAAFEFMRTRPCFRAAWVFSRPPEEGVAEGKGFQIIIHLEPDDAVIRHELGLVLSATFEADEKVVIDCRAEKERMAPLWEAAPPFYQA